MMNCCSYDQYLASLESKPGDNDDPVIKQLQYNAYFEDEEEPGWVIVLPGFKPFRRYNIKPVPEPVIKKKVKRDPGLQHHNEIVNVMKNITLRLAGIDIYSNDEIRTPPNNVSKRRSRASKIRRNNEPHNYEYRGIVEDTHQENSKIDATGPTTR